MEGRLLLDIVVGQGPSIFQLFSSENEPLLIWRNSFLVLDLGLDVFDGIRSLDLQGEGLSIFQLFSSENEPLLVWRNSFLVLDFGLYILNGIRGLDLQGDGLSRQCFDEDLHTSS